MDFGALAKYALIAGTVVVFGGLGVSYWIVTRQPIGDECPQLSPVPEDLVFADRVRSEQRLDFNFDLRQVKGDPQPACLKILGEAKCEVPGPAVLAMQTGHNGTPEIYDIPEGRDAYFRLNATRMLCVLLDP